MSATEVTVVFRDDGSPGFAVGEEEYSQHLTMMLEAYDGITVLSVDTEEV